MAFCNSPANPVQKYRANCSTNDDVICLGSRKFFKNVRYDAEVYLYMKCYDFIFLLDISCKTVVIGQMGTSG